MALTRRALAAVLPLLACAATAVPAPAREPVSQATPAPRDARLMALLAADAASERGLDPLAAFYRGERVEPAGFARLYTDRLDREGLASARRFLEQARQFEAGPLSREDAISLAVFERAKREEVAWLLPETRRLVAVRPFNHFGGLPVSFPALIASGTAPGYASAQDYRDAIALLEAFPKALANAQLRFREGMASGVLEPKVTIENLIAQIDAILAQPPRQSPLWQPVERFPPAMPSAERDRLRRDWQAALETGVYPAYRTLRDFLADEYLPAARDSIGLSQMPGGAALYRQLIERETTFALDPGEIHRLGLTEVARIHAEMEKVRDQIGFKGDLAGFFDHVRADPRFHPRSRADLAKGYRAIARAVDAQVPRFFATVPKTALEIEPFAEWEERYAPGGSYAQGSPDGRRPGVFSFNAYDLPARFLTGMTTLYLHEAIPGHHFQISLAQENTGLPDQQRFEGNNAFVEGWALYAETLGYPMGLFDDPLQHWGNLDDEMLRAMRLVVDTGIHAQGWSRDRAIGYMLANSGMSRTDAESEVDRYIALPAQALSYKIGALTIQRLRREAEEALEDRFDIRAFHEQVLGSGALPLPVLEDKVRNWIERSRQSPPAS